MHGRTKPAAIFGVSHKGFTEDKAYQTSTTKQPVFMRLLQDFQNPFRDARFQTVTEIVTYERILLRCLAVAPVSKIHTSSK
jgi:hypothetical protein